MEKHKKTFLALKFFAHIPFSKFRKVRPLSEKRRSWFSFNIFMSEAWSTAINAKPSPNNFLIMEAFSRYIGRIDDIFDQINRPSFDKSRVEYKKDKAARKHISSFVKQIKRNNLTKSQKKEILYLTGNFRREMYRVLADFEKTRSPSLNQIIKFKEKTSGGMGEVLSEILSISEGISKEERAKVKTSFGNLFMAMQIPDDILDLKADVRNNVANLAFSFLRKNPEEMKKVERVKQLTAKWFKQYCPKTYGELNKLAQSYIEQIPKDTLGQQTISAVAELFFKIKTQFILG